MQGFGSGSLRSPGVEIGQNPSFMVWVWSTLTQISAHVIGKPQVYGIIDFTVFRHLGTLYPCIVHMCVCVCVCVCVCENYILRYQVHKEWGGGACRLEMTDQILESRTV